MVSLVAFFVNFYIPQSFWGELIEMIEFDSYMFHLGCLNHPPGYNLNSSCFFLASVGQPEVMDVDAGCV